MAIERTFKPDDGKRRLLRHKIPGNPLVVALVFGHARLDERMPAVTGTCLRWDYADKVCNALVRLGEWIEEAVTAAVEPGEGVPHRAARDGAQES